MHINRIVLTVQDKSHLLLAYPDTENEQSTNHMQSEIQRMLKWLSKPSNKSCSSRSTHAFIHDSCKNDFFTDKGNNWQLCSQNVMILSAKESMISQLSLVS